VSERLQTRKILTRTSQPKIRGSLLPVTAYPKSEQCSSPSISLSLPEHRHFARQGGGDNAVPQRTCVSPIHCLSCAEVGGATEKAPLLPDYECVLVGRRPSDRCFHRAPFLPYFPSSPSVTRSVLFPRPAARRRSASATPPCGSWFLPEGHPPRKRGLALGSGAPRVASRKSVPRAIRANTNQEKNNGTLRKQSYSEGLHR
jgi:hypothetical protein